MRYENKDKSKTPAVNENATAEKILQAARRLYLEKGYKNVTTREIAAEAQVNLGLIPYYFGSKDNLTGKVFRQLKSELYQSILREYHLEELSSAQQLYVYTMLRWNAAQSTPEAAFLHEYMAEGGSDLSVSEEFDQMSRKIIRDYRLNVTLSENEIYLTALAGTEHALVTRMKKGELNITYPRILDLLISNYFFNLGLPDEEIEKIIRISKEYLSRNEQ